MLNTHVLYECGICDCYHPWGWHGDCREDEYRTFPDEYAQKLGIHESDIEVRSWEERQMADTLPF